MLSRSWGIHQRLHCRTLLTEADLSLAKAIDLRQECQIPQGERNLRTNRATNRKSCYRCGRKLHDQKDCKFRDADCHNCSKRGHIAPACRSPKKRPTRKNNPTKPHSQPADLQKYVTADELVSTGDEECLPLFTVGGGTTPPIKVPLIINNASITMELDTGAAVTIISEK